MPSENLLKDFLSTEEILAYYLDGFEYNRKMHSPFPHRNDPNPSFMVTDKYGHTVWNDFGMMVDNHDGIGFVQHLNQCSREEAIRIIWEDMVLEGEFDSDVKIRTNSKPKRTSNCLIRSLQPWEAAYFHDHGISDEVLDTYNVKSLVGYYCDKNLIFNSERGNPAYVYEEYHQIYRPFADSNKFRTLKSPTEPMGYNQLPFKGEDLIITKAYKDVMVLRMLGAWAVSPYSENGYKLILKFRDILERRFDTIRILFDNDKPGMEAAHMLYDQTGWKMMTVPREYGKDPADVAYNYSLQRLNNLLCLKQKTY